MYQSEHKCKDELRPMHTKEYYLTPKKGNEIRTHAATWINCWNYIKNKDCMTVWFCSPKALEQLSWDGGRLCE